MTELLWIAVPGGRVRDGRAVLRALVVPRIDASGPLSAFAVADWPSLSDRAVLTVEVARDQASPAEAVADAVREQAPPDPARWRAVFPPDLPVRPWRRPTAGAVTVVETSAAHKRVVEGVYREAAAAWGDPEVVEERLRGAELGVAREPGPLPADATPPEEPDFHRVVSLLREHPAVLRALGLIVGFTLPADALLRHAPGLVRIACRFEGADVTDEVTAVSPWTRYDVRDDRFLAVPAAAEDHASGLVDLGRDHWDIATFDVTGGVDRVRDAARGFRERGGPPATLPALRSTGLSLLRADRSADLAARTRVAAANGVESLAGAELTAETLTLGYRVDIRSGTGAWTSVCRRDATYLAADEVTVLAVEPDEEGQVKANGATVDHGHPAAERVLRADEVVTRWNGWSLVCPRSIDKAGRGRARRHASFLRWRHTPLGLPELRFGQDYRMRLRIADIAGGGLTVDDPEVTEGQSREVFYGRLDPVPPPELVPPDGLVVVGEDGGTRSDPGVLGPGGRLDVLVIRDDPAGYPLDDSRVLLPPPASFTLVEQHGRFAGVDSATCAAWLGRATSPPSYTVDGRYTWLPDPAAKGVALRLRPAPGTALPEQAVDDAWSLPSGAWPDFPAKRLELRPAQPGRPALDWVDDAATAVVRLGPAEVAVVEVSSSVTNDDVDKFAMRDWLGVPRDGDVDDVLAAMLRRVRDGLHPMVSPTRRITLVHAVRRPLGTPSGTLTAARSLNAAHAEVHDVDPANALLGVHPGSTAQVDLDARWTEALDDVRSERVQRVDSFTLDVVATSLPPLRHEFGDTKHRRITYTLGAVSRFRSYFAAGPDADFTASATFAEVRVPSSARPAPPTVLSATPAFRWEGTDLPPGWTRVVRVRRGGVVRVELARPWYTTGEGERLAVLVWPSGTNTGKPDAVVPFLSVVGRDPVWATPAPVLDPEAHLFAGTCADPAPVTLTETGHTVVAVPYEPVLRGASWHADVEIPPVAAASYGPFVRLAVARHQPDSVAGAALSTVVRTDMVRVLPDRTLTVSRDQGGVHVRLDGIGPVGGQANRVVAVVERLPAGVASSELTAVVDGGPGWVRTAAAEGPLATDLPPLVVPGGGPLRLVVREVEQLPALGSPGGTLADELAERTVYLDVVPLD